MHDVDVGCTTHESHPDHDGAIDEKALYEKPFRVGEKINEIDQLKRRQNPYMLSFDFEKLK